MSDYSDIIYYDYKMKHERSPQAKRAAQFSPFAALTGYEDAIIEEARITLERPMLGDDEVIHISNKLSLLNVNDKIKVRYFQADRLKEGGSILEYSGEFKRIEEGFIIFNDKKKIVIDDIVGIDKE